MSSNAAKDESFLLLSQTSSPAKKSSSVGLYTTIGIGSIAIAFSIIAIPFITPALRKHTLPYVPATNRQIDNVFKAINQLQKGTPTVVAANSNIKLIDLGSGDGRIVFEAAKRGYSATGVEINLFLYLYSRFKALTTSSKPSPVFKRANLWNVNLGNYDLIVLFGVAEMMNDLVVKLNKEIKPNSKVITCRFPMNEHKEIYNLDDSMDSVWIYDKESLRNKIEKSEK